MNDFIVEDYRNVISNLLLSNPLIVGILSNDEYIDESDLENLDEADALIDHNLIAQHYIPGVVEETGSYIMYDLDEVPMYPRDSKQNTYTEVHLMFWLVTHRGMAKYKTKIKEEPFASARNMFRNDLLAREIKKIFEYKDNLGIAPNHLIYNKTFFPDDKDYYGRVLYFTITDWSNKVRNRAVNLYG